jgi:hypothetical protein
MQVPIIGQRGRHADLSWRDFAEITGGVAELSPYMKPSGGGTSEFPAFRFIGGDADATGWTTWDYPGTPVVCARQAVTTPPTYNDGSPYSGSDDDSVCFNASDYYQAPNTGFGQIATEDFILEVVFQTADLVGTNSIAGTRNAGVGWQFFTAGVDDTLRFRMEDSGANNTVISAALNPYTWYYVLLFANRSGSAQFYIDGVASGAAKGIATSVLTLDSTVAFCIGSQATGTNPFSGCCSYLALWKKAAWLTSHLNPDTAAERFRLLAGYWPQLAKGTAAPTVSTRAYAAYQEKIESGKSRLYLMGSEHLRVESDGTRSGILVEPQAKNHLDWSNIFAGYALEDGGDSINDNNDTSPDNLTRSACLVCDNTNGNHGMSDTTPGNLTADKTCFSAWCTTGLADWVKLEDTTIANAHCWFNLATGALGTRGSGSDEAKFVGGDRIYLGPSGETTRRAYIRFMGTVAPHTFRVRPVDGDGVDTFSGGNGADPTIHTFGWQVETGERPTSLVETAGATATRLADSLQFKADDGNIGGVGSELRGSCQFMVKFPSYTNATARALAVLSDGGSVDDRIRIACATTGYARVLVYAATVNTVDITGTNVLLTDGEWHRIWVTWQENDVRLYVDGVLEGRDTSCAIPNDLDRMDIGQSVSSAEQPGARIADAQFYRRPTRRAA